MTSNAKLAWFVLFSCSVFMMVMGILDSLHHAYPTAMIQIGIGLMLFSDLFDLDYFTQPLSLTHALRPKKFDPFSFVSMINYIGIVLWVIGVIGWLFQ